MSNTITVEEDFQDKSFVNMSNYMNTINGDIQQ